MGSLKNQVIGNVIDPGTLHFLNEYQNIETIYFSPDHVVVDLPKDTTTTVD